jgi:NAD-dependent deacetylase
MKTPKSPTRKEGKMSFEIPQALIEKLLAAKRITVITGAGVSAESGIPTFRDAQTGLWANYRAEELATPQAFRANPELVWDWYAWRRKLVGDADPNPGHFALAELENWAPAFDLITQNVDGLHQIAGSKNVTELHGNIRKVKGLDCQQDRECPSRGEAERYDDATEKPPRCAVCGTYMRPGVVWFGESLSPESIEAAAEAASNCDVFFSVGTSAIVYPAASFIYQALANGAATVEINPQPTPQSEEVHFSLKGGAGSVLPALMQQLKEQRP